MVKLSLRKIREGSADAAFIAKAGLLGGGIALITGLIFRNRIYQYFKKTVSNLQAAGIKATAEDLQTIEGAVSIVDAANRVDDAAQNGSISNTDVIKVAEDNRITDVEQAVINFRTYCLQMGSKKMSYNPMVLILASAPVLVNKKMTQDQINADIQWAVDKLMGKPVGALPY